MKPLPAIILVALLIGALFLASDYVMAVLGRALNSNETTSVEDMDFEPLPQSPILNSYP